MVCDLCERTLLHDSIFVDQYLILKWCNKCYEKWKSKRILYKTLTVIWCRTFPYATIVNVTKSCVTSQTIICFMIQKILILRTWLSETVTFFQHPGCDYVFFLLPSALVIHIFLYFLYIVILLEIWIVFGKKYTTYLQSKNEKKYLSKYLMKFESDDGKLQKER